MANSCFKCKRAFFFLFLAYSLLSSPPASAKNTGLESFYFFSLIPKSWVNYFFSAPSLEQLPADRLSDEIRYGHELISRTAIYLGPKGSVGKYLGNRMNCQNCHLAAGQRLFGGSFSTTHGRYPEYRARENFIQTLADRINLCIVRPHNGKPLPYESRELRAMQIYIKWLGQNTQVGSRQFGDSLVELPFLNRAADPVQGKSLYKEKCLRCHGENGQGLLDSDGKTFIYPPLWGMESYGIGSSMHRIRPAAAFIKMNMPFGVTWENPELTDEEAWDLAAFINDDRIHPRPKVDVSKDYPDLKEKPIDYPFGPYLDNFSEEQHKFGPFLPIKNAQKQLIKEKKDTSTTK